MNTINQETEDFHTSDVQRYKLLLSTVNIGKAFYELDRESLYHDAFMFEQNSY